MPILYKDAFDRFSDKVTLKQLNIALRKESMVVKKEADTVPDHEVRLHFAELVLIQPVNVVETSLMNEVMQELIDVNGMYDDVFDDAKAQQIISNKFTNLAKKFEKR